MSRRGNRHWFRDHGALLIGCVAGAALTLIARSSWLDPVSEVQREIELIERSAEIEIIRTWESERQRFVPQRETSVAWQGVGVFPLPQFDPASARAIDIDTTEQINAFDLLFQEATRAELAGALDQALQDLRDARTRTDDPRRHLLSDLRQLQVAAKAKDYQTLKVALTSLLQLADGRETIAGVSVLLTALATVLSLEDEFDGEFAEAREALISAGIDALSKGMLALPPLQGRVIKEDGVHRLVLSPEREIYLQPLLNSGNEQLAALVRKQLRDDRVSWLARYYRELNTQSLSPSRVRVQDRINQEFLSDAPHQDLAMYAKLQGGNDAKIWLIPKGELLQEIQNWLLTESEIPERVQLSFYFEEEGRNLANWKRLEDSPVRLKAELRDSSQFARDARSSHRLVVVALHALGFMCAFLGWALHRQRKRELAIQELKSDFVANVSHELRTPLSSILLMAENLSQGKVQEQTRERYHSLILREAQRLRRLVDDVLDFSRLDRGDAPKARLEPHRADRLASNLNEDAQRWADQHGVALTMRVQWPEVNLDADEDALQRAMLNLLDNARRHSGSTQIELELREEADALWISVRDFGRGIPEGMSRKLFDPYVQLEGKQTQGHGAGLGLSIVAAIAAAHGGTVVANNHPEGGALFAVILPLSDSNHDDSTPSR